MNVKVKQRDITDCGAACLASVAAWYKLLIPVARIRQYAGTDKKGTNVLGLVKAAEKMGFAAKGVKGEWESLFQIPKPAIAHIVVKEVLQHYVVVLEANKKHIKIMDPGDGEIHKVPHEEFRKQWTGILVLLMPDDGFRPANEKVSSGNRFYQLIKPHRGILMQTVLGSMVVTILGLSTSVFVGKLVDYVIPNSNLNLLNLMGVAMILIIAVQLILNIFQSIFIIKTGQRIDLPPDQAQAARVRAYHVDAIWNALNTAPALTRKITIEDFAPICRFTEEGLVVVAEAPQYYTLAIGAAAVYAQILAA